LSPEEQRVLDELFGDGGVGVKEVIEGERRLFILPKVTLPVGSVPAEAFGIYHASPHGGYSTRLFFEASIKGANGATPPTTTDVFLGRTMHAASWNGVPADLPPHEGILAHLRLYEATP
jgi:hypothetical protein